LKPIYQITVDGLDVSRHIESHFVSVSTTDNKGQESDSLTLVLEDSNGQIPMPPDKAAITVAMGDAEQGLGLARVFTLSGVQLAGPPDRMVISRSSASWQDAAVSAIQSRKTRSWDRVTLGEIVSVITQEHGYKPEVAPELADEYFEHLSQTNSDIHFLNSIVSDLGAIVRPCYGTL